MNLQSLKKFGTIVFRKSPNIKVLAKFQCMSIISPIMQIAEQNWYTWHTRDVLYVHTKFHLDDICGSWDTDRNCLFCTNAVPVTKIKVKGRQQWYKCVKQWWYNHIKFHLARYYSLWEKSNVKFLSTTERPDVRRTDRQTHTDHN